MTGAFLTPIPPENGQRRSLSHGCVGRKAGLRENRAKYRNSPLAWRPPLEGREQDRRLQPLIGLPAFQVVQRSAAERRETGAEDEPRVGEVGIGDDALGDDGLSFLEVGRDELLGEFGRDAARGAFACLAVLPDVEAAAGFLAEISRG